MSLTWYRTCIPLLGTHPGAAASGGQFWAVQGPWGGRTGLFLECHFPRAAPSTGSCISLANMAEALPTCPPSATRFVVTMTQLITLINGVFPSLCYHFSVLKIAHHKPRNGSSREDKLFLGPSSKEKSQTSELPSPLLTMALTRSRGLYLTKASNWEETVWPTSPGAFPNCSRTSCLFCSLLMMPSLMGSQSMLGMSSWLGRRQHSSIRASSGSVM